VRAFFTDFFFAQEYVKVFTIVGFKLSQVSVSLEETAFCTDIAREYQSLFHELFGNSE